ncbi:MAG TPA: LON peptidase substrate-binding domain-containing protein [Hyphomicrobiales bacterium]|nr:LON peptidase substrate-binding domain-containing protein [Hyphomicrobiales bacterium]
MAANRKYQGPQDLPPVIPVFPLPAALLLPRGQLPLNIFEPRYVAMIDDALSGDRIIGMVQPALKRAGDDAAAATREAPKLARVGCAGRLTSFTETNDGRYLITLNGVSRFHIVEEIETDKPYRLCRIDTEPFGSDFVPGFGEEAVDRDALLAAFRAYLDTNDMEADWDNVAQVSNEVLVNTLSMMSPYGPAEKQALLEAPDLVTRAETLIAVTEIALARANAPEEPSSLQ